MYFLQVIVSGGYRTGSTLANLITLEIFNHVYAGDFVQGTRLNEEIKLFNEFIPAVFKSHDFYPNDKDFKIIHTVRNPFDILSSLKKCRPALPDYVAEVKEIILRDKYFKPNKDILVLKYEDFFDNELKAINKIIKFLDVDYPYAEVLANRYHYKRIKSFTDFLEPGNPTLYTAFHISEDPSPGNYVNYLDMEEIKELEDFLAEIDNV
jgi:hypothetical protein